MAARTVDEFLALARRELGALSARVAEPSEARDEDGGRALWHELPGGRALCVTFAAPPADPAALRDKLDLLADSFEGLLVTPAAPERRTREELAGALSEALAVLVERAGGCTAVVIDSRSPVVFSAQGELRFASTVLGVVGAAGLERVPREDAEDDPVSAARRCGIPTAAAPTVSPSALGLLPRAVCERHRVAPLRRDERAVLLAMADPFDAAAVGDAVLLTGLAVEPIAVRAAHLPDLIDAATTALAAEQPGYEAVLQAAEAGAPPELRERAAQARGSWRTQMAARRAVAIVRAHPAMAGLHRGAHLHVTETGEGFGYIARSFAVIYVLIVVFDAPVTELRTRGAVAHALPGIERLVLAMPPLEPGPPVGQVVAMRRGRPRRR
jgi:hypothetical protein